MGPDRIFRLTMSAWCAPALTLLALVATLHVGGPPADAADAVTTGMDKVRPLEFNGDVRDLPLFYSPATVAPRLYRPLLKPPRPTKIRAPAEAPDGSAASAPLAPMPSPTQDFAGLSQTDLCGGVPCSDSWPPDPNGDVGLNHYIVAVNTAYAIYSKTGTLLASFTENQLWSTGGTNPCNGNSFGDPIVLYDQLADRWILTHFAFALSGGDPVSPFYQCIAASKTSDPVSGGWWLYPLRMDPGGAGLPPVGALNDYAKFGIWPDCLYMAANEFQAPAFGFVGTAFASFSRSDLYSGAPLTWALGFINNATGPFTMIPSNLSGRAATALPAGTPNYFVSESTTLFTFEVRKFTAGLNCGGGGTLSAATNVSQTSYTVPPGDNVPQPGTMNTLDSIDDRLMQKVQYRKVGAAESLWVVHNVQTPSSTVKPQWAQLDVTGGVISTTPVQQQIYAPDSLLHRWMGSLAVDSQGNMALGYSTSNGISPNFPSIAYSGRLATDPLNTLPQSEVQLVAGLGSQTNNCGGVPCHRWGDYTAMSVDPADDCTFWYTNQYYSSAANGASGNWQTRVGSFKFLSCGGPIQDFVTRFYSSVLERSPDPEGLAFWVNFLQTDCNATGFNGIAVGFFDSPEFRLTKPQTLTTLVTKLYNTFLGRNPEPVGLAAWVAIFRQARLLIATQGFIPSPEFQGSLPNPADMTAVSNFVTRFYTQVLQRSPEPAGLAFWVDFIQNTGDFAALAEGFLLSPEFEGRALTFRDYVTILYRTFLDREPDGPGLDAWEFVLRTKLLDVINTGFVPSPEFQSNVGTLCGT